jgi:hypothetical protein
MAEMRKSGFIVLARDISLEKVPRRARVGKSLQLV